MSVGTKRAALLALVVLPASLPAQDGPAAVLETARVGRIQLGARLLGVELGPHIEFVIDALRPAASELALLGSDAAGTRPGSP